MKCVPYEFRLSGRGMELEYNLPIPDRMNFKTAVSKIINAPLSQVKGLARRALNFDQSSRLNIATSDSVPVRVVTFQFVIRKIEYELLIEIFEFDKDRDIFEQQFKQQQLAYYKPRNRYNPITNSNLIIERNGKHIKPKVKSILIAL